MRGKGVMQILLVDDDRTILFTVGSFLRQLGHAVTEAVSADEALTYLAEEDFSMVLTDIVMPGTSGIELLKEIQGMPLVKCPKVVLFTGYGDLESAIAAIRAGAYDYLLKPIKIEELTKLLRKVEEYGDAENEARQCESLSPVMHDQQEPVYIYSNAMASVVAQARKYHTDRTIPVLIEGETGTGKEVIAKIIHGNGTVSNAPFIAVNCGAIPNSLFESELFGYEAGTFTGGRPKGKKGMIEAASGGTLFLDEIGELPIDLQVKLLRVLEEREYYRIGGVKKIKANIRVICATNADLLLKVREGHFRKDLYYRLRGGIISLAPLREMKNSIMPLATRFLRRAARQKAKMFRSISKAAAEVLLNYQWPGNVRELKNVIEWAVFMYNDVLLQPEHFSNILVESSKSNTHGAVPPCVDWANLRLPSGEFPLDDFIHRIVMKAIDMHKGNKAAAARYLKISRREFYGRFKEAALKGEQEHEQ